MVNEPCTRVFTAWLMFIKEAIFLKTLKKTGCKNIRFYNLCLVLSRYLTCALQAKEIQQINNNFCTDLYSLYVT